MIKLYLEEVLTGVLPFTKKVVLSECCGEGCGSILIPNVYPLNRTRTNQAQIYIMDSESRLLIIVIKVSRCLRSI
jgi:hypothetical protein